MAFDLLNTEVQQIFIHPSLAFTAHFTFLLFRPSFIMLRSHLEQQK